MLGGQFGINECRRVIAALLCLVLPLLIAGCPGGNSSSSSSSSSSTTTTPPAAPVGMITGQWTVTETAKTANSSLCQPPADPLSTPYSLWFTQSGSTVTARDASGNVFTNGTLNGSTLTYTGSYPDGAGTTTLQPMTATIASTCNSATGTATWSYSETGFSCAGTTTFTATRTVGSGCGTVTTRNTATDTEPNDTPSTVQAVTRPVTVTGDIKATETAASRTDLYSSFTLAASAPVTIMLQRTAGTADLDLRLQNSTGTMIAQSTTALPSEVITQANLAAGTYMVMVSPFGTVVGTTTYSLVIQ